jgi:hypothetical protein
MASPKTLARVAGVFYLLMFGFTFLATGLLNSILVAPPGRKPCSRN